MIPLINVVLFYSFLYCVVTGTGIDNGRKIKPDSGSRPPSPEWTSREPYAANIPQSAFTSMTRVSSNYRIYHDIWYHNQRWYAILPSDNVGDKSIEDGLSPNNGIFRMPITDLNNFTKNLRVSDDPQYVAHSCTWPSRHITWLAWRDSPLILDQS